MQGTLVNTGTILAGSLVGLAAGKHMPFRVKDILMQALGLVTITFGFRMILLDGRNASVILAAGTVIAGGLTGELIGIEQGMERFAEWLKKVLRSGSPTFVEGFVAASVMYLVGPMMILGCLEDGLAGNHQTLYLKALLDGVASVALASSLGPGVALSAISVLLVQGGITLGASFLVFARDPAVLASVSATGGMLIMGIGITLLGLKPIRTGNLVPALVFAIIGPLVL